MKDGVQVLPGKNSNELIHNGTIRNGRQADIVVKPNDATKPTDTGKNSNGQ
jgi:hypothetical protein